MSKFAYEAISWLEFEELCSALLQQLRGCRYERFGEGRDDGIDLRSINSKGDVEIVQCKRYKNFSSLLRVLAKTELVKVKALGPQKYCVLTTCSLSPNNKKKIKEIFKPYIASESDIIGREELDDLLSRPEYSHVVNQTVGLWWSSFDGLKNTFFNRIFGRTRRRVKMFNEELRNSYWTHTAEEALEVLRKKHVVVVIGEPGVGKTTTAKMLFARAYADGYEPIVIRGGVSECEDAWDDTKKQVFYFDDFLGSNYLESFGHSEASGILDLIKDVRRVDNKLFILTTRTVILSEATNVSKPFSDENIINAEYVYCIGCSSDLEKANILYCQMKKCNPSDEVVRAILEKRNYERIVRHRNFNPRLVESILKSLTCQGFDKKNMFARIQELLDKPEAVWDFLFTKQINQVERLIVWAVFLAGHLKESTFISLYKYASIREDDLRDVRRVLESAIIKRVVEGWWGEPRYELQNPSIGDYLIHHLKDGAELAYNALWQLGDVSTIERFFYMIDKCSVPKDYWDQSCIALISRVDLNDDHSKAMAYKIVAEMVSREVGLKKDVLLPKFGPLQVDKNVSIELAGAYAEYVARLNEIGRALDVDFIREFKIELNPYEQMILIRVCDKLDVCFEIINAAIKRGWGIESDLVEYPLSCRIGESIFKLVDSCSTPEFDFYDDGSWRIPDDEIERLEQELAEAIKRELENYDIPDYLVEMSRILEAVDFRDYFEPCQEEIARHRGFVYDDDELRHAPKIKVDKDDGPAMERLFATFPLATKTRK